MRKEISELIKTSTGYGLLLLKVNVFLTNYSGLLS